MQTTNLPRAPFYKAASLNEITRESPFWFGNLVHIYLEISIDLDLEGAESITNAKRAHQYIRKAADASFLTAEQFDGQVLEIQGRILHIGIPYELTSNLSQLIRDSAGMLHSLLKQGYGNGGPKGWKMAADHGPTLTISSIGIHDDTSLVSLSPAANLPAKKLGNDEVPLNHLGANIDNVWECEHLEEIAQSSPRYEDRRTARGTKLFEDVMIKRAKAVRLDSLSSIRQINLQAAPLGNPNAEDLFSCFGYVLSMDLDGFTKKVATAANGTLVDQQELAQNFFKIMEKSSEFAQTNPEWFIQFPFAGDNAIFALTTKNLHDFEALKKEKPVSIAIEWEKKMGDLARNAGFGGWGQAAASGNEIPHGNSRGNLHISGIQLGERRFLVGIGPGMRYARQAFNHVDPAPTEIAMYQPNVSDLHTRLKEKFHECPSKNGGTSTYFKKASTKDLEIASQTLQAEQAAKISELARSTIGLSNTQIVHRPHACAD